MKAISIRQPWAWAIIHAGKDIENRNWSTSYRGPILIHAAKGMTAREYMDFIDALGLDATYAEAVRRAGGVPPEKDLQRGGIIGKARIVDCVSQHSPQRAMVRHLDRKWEALTISAWPQH